MTAQISSLILGPTLKQKMDKAGFEDVKEIIEAGPVQLAHELDISHTEALDLIKYVQNSTEKTKKIADSGIIALDMLTQEHLKQKIITLCEQLDRILGGGIRIGEMTDICGGPGSGKTQLCMQLACDVQIPNEFDGLNGKTLYIDTEGGFMPERIYEIAEALIFHMKQMTLKKGTQKQIDLVNNLTVDKILSNILVSRIFDYTQLLACIKSLKSFILEHDIKLVIIDSVAFPFRSDCDDMHLRSRLLTTIAQDLNSLAYNSNIAVVTTNHLTTKIGHQTQTTTSESYLIPALGESWAHACTNRILMGCVSVSPQISSSENSSGNMVIYTRIAELIKSPYQPRSSAQFIITQAGIRDIRRKKTRPRDNEDQENTNKQKEIKTLSNSNKE